ncbi:MAG: hypothetical protein FWH18_08230 [Marinilabiliaceae bacterium]|nr:hypothetical protein [Marinilabiliaceae bacterium]
MKIYRNLLIIVSALTIEMLGTVDGNVAVVGLVGRDKTTGDVQSFSGDTFYSDALLELFPSSKSGSNEMGNKYQRYQKRL